MLFAPSSFYIQLEHHCGGCCILFSVFLCCHHLTILCLSIIFIVSLLWSWIVVGRLIFCVSLKLLFKPRCWALIIAVMIQLYFTDFKTIDHQLFAFLYILFTLGYILFDLGLFPFWYYVGILLF